MNIIMYLYVDIHGMVNMHEDLETATRRAYAGEVRSIEVSDEFIDVWARIMKEYSELYVDLMDLWYSKRRTTMKMTKE